MTTDYSEDFYIESSEEDDITLDHEEDNNISNLQEEYELIDYLSTRKGKNISPYYKIKLLSNKDRLEEYIKQVPELIEEIPFPSEQLKITAFSLKPSVNIVVEPGELQLIKFILNWIKNHKMTDDNTTVIIMAAKLSALGYKIYCDDSELMAYITKILL